MCRWHILIFFDIFVSIWAVALTVKRESWREVDMPVGVPFLLEVAPEEVLQLHVLKIPPDAQYMLVQMHNPRGQLQMSSSQHFDVHGQTSAWLSDVGIVAYVQGEETVVVYVNVSESTWANTSLTVTATPHFFTDPIVGGCNMELPLSEDPNIYWTLLDGYKVDSLQFACSNYGNKATSRRQDCENRLWQRRLQYDLYMAWLPNDDLTVGSYHKTLAGLLTPPDIRANARKIFTFHDGEKTRARLGSFYRQGVVYAIIVREFWVNSFSHGLRGIRPGDTTLREAAYVPSVSYACHVDDARGDCTQPTPTSMLVMTGICGVLGLVLSLAGHRYFTFSVALFSFLLASLIGYFILARVLGADPAVWSVAGCGAAGALLWTLLWLLRGAALLAMLPAAIVNAFLVSALILTYSHLGRLTIMLTGWVLGACFSLSVALLALLHFVAGMTQWRVCPRPGHVVACASVGGYMCVLLVDTFYTSNMSHFLLHVLRKGALPEYADVLVVVGYQARDVMLTFAWISVFVLGVTTQCYTEYRSLPVPVSPYLAWRARRHKHADGAETSERRPLLCDTYSDIQGERTPLIRALQRPPAALHAHLVDPAI